MDGQESPVCFHFGGLAQAATSSRGVWSTLATFTSHTRPSDRSNLSVIQVRSISYHVRP